MLDLTAFEVFQNPVNMGPRVELKDGDVSRKPDLIAHSPKRRGEEDKEHEACHSLWADIPLAQTRTASSPSSAQMRESAGR